MKKILIIKLGAMGSVLLPLFGCLRPIGLASGQTTGRLTTTNLCAANHQVYVSGGGCYRTIQAAMSACLADSSCGIVDASGAGPAQSNSGSLTIGSNSQPVELRLAVGVLTTTGTINVSQYSGISCAIKTGMSRGVTDFAACYIRQANVANLAATISLNGALSYLQDIGCDGNSTNNPMAGPCILVNKASRTQLSRVNAQNSSTHGIWVNSTSANESCCFKWDHIMAVANRASGVFGVNTGDGFIADSEFENNGAPSALSNPALTVTVSLGTSISITSGSISTDSSLLQNWVRIGAATGCLAKISSIASTTSLTLDRPCANGSGQQLTYGSGIELLESPTWRMSHVDIGGNQKGVFASCGGTGFGVTGTLISGGTQFGNQVEEDFHVEGPTSPGQCAGDMEVSAEYIGSSFNPDAVYSQIFLNNATNSKFEFVGYSNSSPHRNTYPISIRETDPGFSTNNWVHLHGFPNNYAASFSVNDTGAYPGIDIVERNLILPNGFALQSRDSSGTPQNMMYVDTRNDLVLTGHPARKMIYFQPNPSTNVFELTETGIGNQAGLQVFNSTTTCTTAATAGAQCTTALITLPVAEGDTNYRLVCTGISPSGVPVISSVTKSSARQFSITITSITAAAATYGSFDCWAAHN